MLRMSGKKNMEHIYVLSRKRERCLYCLWNWALMFTRKSEVSREPWTLKAGQRAGLPGRGVSHYLDGGFIFILCLESVLYLTTFWHFRPHQTHTAIQASDALGTVGWAGGLNVTTEQHIGDLQPLRVTSSLEPLSSSYLTDKRMAGMQPCLLQIQYSAYLTAQTGEPRKNLITPNWPKDHLSFKPEILWNIPLGITCWQLVTEDEISTLKSGRKYRSLNKL